MNAREQFHTHRLAVLIDADNANAKILDSLLKEIAKYGTANVKRIYGDWTSTRLNSWKSQLLNHAIQPIQQFSYTTGKNATDSALIIDAMDLLYTENFDGFCIVSSDSDFTRLACRIREAGLVVYGFGEGKTPSPFVKACNKFIYTEILENRKEPEKNDENSSKNSVAKSSYHQLLIDAYEAASGDDDWVGLAAVGSQLTKLSPSFDPRNYGYKKLSQLVQASNLFDIKNKPHLRICLKNKS
ncbi:NYN domain-containing protein [Baaleninema sp.]|uniref:NYN domain-containing protein n=1 Tax=Baaleninema sp. TaxID=3101197 RepID=UPI003D00F38C